MPAAASRKKQHNILLLIFDSLSASHMSLHGYRRNTTPNLDRFAEKCWVYHNHYTGGNFTTPGTATLLTGNYPWAHRAFNHAGSVTEEFVDRNLFSLFRNSPYNSLAFSHNLLADSLLSQFEDHIDDHLHPGSFSTFYGHFADRLFPRDSHLASLAVDEFLLQRGRVPGSLFLSIVDRIRLAVTKRVAFSQSSEEYPKGLPELFKFAFRLPDVINGMIQKLSSAPKPFLAYFHVLPPHEPYRPSRDFVDLFADGWKPREKPGSLFSQGHSLPALHQFRREYDTFLAYADAEFGRLIDNLQRSGLLKDTLIIFTSDHGQLFERGIHGHETQTLFDPVIRAPLLIHPPGSKVRVDVQEPVSATDIVPTLLASARLDIPGWLTGEVLPPFRGTDLPSMRPVYSLEAKSNPKRQRLSNATISMRQDRYKLVHYMGYDRHSGTPDLFDLEKDPEERQPLESRIAEDLLSRLKLDLEKANDLYRQA
jgi:arylsulfatase A-like enzyme